jgi:hypothetical protein
MAEENSTRNVTRFPEFNGKTIQGIEVYVAADHYSINVNFTDKTALVFSMEASISVFPYHGDWGTGDCKVLQEWAPVRSISLRV